jgi:hypothetical protein
MRPTCTKITRPPVATYISDVAKVAQGSRHSHDVHKAERGRAPRPAEVLVAVNHHVCVSSAQSPLCCCIFLFLSLSSERVFSSACPPPSPPSSTTAHALRSHGVHPSLQTSLHQITEKSVRVRVCVQPRAGDVLFHFKIAGSWRRTVVSAVSHCGACGGRERRIAQHAYPGVRGGLPLWLFVGSRVGVSFVWAACGHGGGSCDVGGSGAARLGVWALVRGRRCKYTRKNTRLLQRSSWRSNA